MLKVENLKLSPGEPLSALTVHAARALKLRERDILSIRILRRSVDAREEVKLVYTAAVELAADASYDPQSAQEYGVWQVKKLYRHLGSQPTTVMDWSQPLSAFGGDTGFQVARRAFAWHESQTKDDRWQVAYKGSRFDSTLYTLVFSTVGEDEAGNDFFEHIEK